MDQLIGTTGRALKSMIAACLFFLTCLTTFSQEVDYVGLRKAGLDEYRSHHYRQAEAMLETAISAAQKANDQYEVALDYSALGDVYQEEERFREAEQLYRKSISFLLLQPSHKHALAIVWRNLASVLTIETQYDEAMAALNQASKFIAASKLLDRQLNAQILNGRGVIYFHRGNFGKAKAFFERAGKVTLIPAETRDVATEDILNNLALAYHTTGQYAKAEETYKRALNLAEIRLGPSHRDLAVLLTNLGGLYTDLKRYTDAEDHFQRAILILEQPVTTVDGDRLMEALYGLAKTYMRQNEQAKAEPVLRRASEIARRSLNQPILIPEILDVLDDYAKVLRDLSHPVDADRTHAEAQRIRASAAFTVEAKPRLKFH